MSSSDATQVSPTTDEDPPHLPPNHLNRAFTNRFLNAIKKNDFLNIEAPNQLFINISKTDADFMRYDCSAMPRRPL